MIIISQLVILFFLLSMKVSTKILVVSLRHLFILFFLLLLSLPFSLDLLEELFDLPHYPGLILCVESGIVDALVLGRLLNKGHLLLHHSEPLVLFYDHILNLNLRINCETVVKVKLSVRPPHLLYPLRYLIIVLFLSSLQNGA